MPRRGSRRCAGRATGWWRDEPPRHRRPVGPAAGRRPAAAERRPVGPRGQGGPRGHRRRRRRRRAVGPGRQPVHRPPSRPGRRQPAERPAGQHRPIPRSTRSRPSAPASPATSTTRRPSCGWCDPTVRPPPSSPGPRGCPTHHWSPGGVTLSTAGSPFRFDTTGVDGGWLVAGESVSKVGQARDQLLIAEGVLGALLLLVTFVGSFVVGLRASAPIEQIRRRQAEFTADASHELRTPLSVIEAEVDLALSRERSAAAYQDTLRRVASESGRLRSIVEDLLWLARADGSPPEEHTDRVVDVAEVGTSCLTRFRAVADAASVTLTNRIDPDLPLPHPRRRRLHRPADQRAPRQRLPVRGDRGGRARRRARGGVARRAGGADRRRRRPGDPRGPPPPGLRPVPPGRRHAGRDRVGPGHRRRRGQEQRWHLVRGHLAPGRRPDGGVLAPGPSARGAWARPSPSVRPRADRNSSDLGLFFGKSYVDVMEPSGCPRILDP